MSIYDAIREHTGIDISQMDESELRQVCRQLHLEVDDTMGKGKLIDTIFGEKCEPHYIQPTFITDYPVEMSPLTKKHRSQPGLVERFELMANGKEIANAYSELNDPLEQQQRFEEQMKLMERGDHEAMYIDHDFLRALQYGMPPTAGIGFGIDRIAMLMTNSPSIQDVLFFPQMRPEKNQGADLERELETAGVRKELIPLIQKMGVQSMAQLKEMKPTKLFNDLAGLRKKMKLEITNATVEEIEGWLK